MTRRFLLLAMLLTACEKSKAPPPPARAVSAAPAPLAGAAPGTTCPATGLWAECSVLYRLDRAGLAPKLDSGATASEPGLTHTGFRVKIGLSASLDVFLYPDSTARAAAAARLDKSKFVNAYAPQTMARERTLIQAANSIALLTSINDHQRQRVSDALMAGPPQPSTR